MKSHIPSFGVSSLARALCLALGTVCLLASQAAGKGSAAAPPQVPVHAVKLERRTLRRYVVGYGALAPAPPGAARPGGLAILRAPAAGLVVEAAAPEGRKVRRGERVLRFDSRAADAALARAEAELKAAQAEFDRQRRLAKEDNASQKALQQAAVRLAAAHSAVRQAEVARGYLDLTAPMDGVVARLYARPGEFLPAGAPAAAIAALAGPTAEVYVPAFELAQVHPGQEADVFLVGRRIKGKVSFVAPQVAPETGSGLVRIELDKTEGLRPGEFARAEIVVETRARVLAAPLSSVVHKPGGKGLLALIRNGSARLAPVTLGIEEGDWVEVRGEGLREGTLLVGPEAYGLPDGTPIRILNP